MVIVIALVALILILGIVGFFMAQNKVNYIYPPSSIPCPNYWQQNGDGTCAIPTSIVPPPGVPPTPPVNIGTWDGKTMDGKTALPGLKSGNIDFTDAGWASSNGLSATCAKQKWAKQYGILWDGVVNYNGCA